MVQKISKVLRYVVGKDVDIINAFVCDVGSYSWSETLVYTIKLTLDVNEEFDLLKFLAYLDKYDYVLQVSYLYQEPNRRVLARTEVYRAEDIQYYLGQHGNLDLG